MTVGQVSTRSPRHANTGHILLDGLFTGAIGAVVVALWFLLLDLVAGRPFFPPALLGSVLLHGGGAAAHGVTAAPLAVAAHTPIHFLALLPGGVALSSLQAP